MAFKYPPSKRYEHIREEIKEILDKKQELTREQIENFRLNSYEWYELYALFSKEDLIKQIENSLFNCTRIDFPTTYEDTLIKRLIPLLLEKIKMNEPIQTESDNPPEKYHFKEHELHKNLVMTAIRILKFTSKEKQLEQIHTMFYEFTSVFLPKDERIEPFKKD